MATEVLKCNRHQESTRLRCAECQSPICPRCLVRTEVGMRCEECARPAAVAEVAPPGRGKAVAAAVAGALLLCVGVVLVLSTRSSDRTNAALPGDASGSWTVEPSLATIRGSTTVVVLGDGQALVTGGGVGRIALGAAEAFDPARRVWRSVAPLHQVRRGHQAVLLNDGRVLVAGGLAEGQPLASAEIYDPATDRWTTTGPMASPRLGGSLTVLRDGRVLAAGGIGGTGTGADGAATAGPMASTELFDPAAATWRSASAMTTARFEHTATLLEDGRVLIAGGLGADVTGTKPIASTELFDPAAGSFVRSTDLSEARSNHVAAMLADKTVLVAGGLGGSGGGDSGLASAEVFDPRRGSWTKVASLTQGRTGATATGLADGQVLVAGGEAVDQGSRRSLAVAEVYDPAGSRWRSAGQMSCPRSEGAAALLRDGSVLVVAGDAAFPGQAPMAQSCVDRYQPAAIRAR